MENEENTEQCMFRAGDAELEFTRHAEIYGEILKAELSLRVKLGFISWARSHPSDLKMSLPSPEKSHD